jgi:hypothetical protein
VLHSFAFEDRLKALTSEMFPVIREYIQCPTEDGGDMVTEHVDDRRLGGIGARLGPDKPAEVVNHNQNVRSPGGNTSWVDWA